jgi:hypothetical protein
MEWKQGDGSRASFLGISKGEAEEPSPCFMIPLHESRGG